MLADVAASLVRAALVGEWLVVWVPPFLRLVLVVAAAAATAAIWAYASWFAMKCVGEHDEGLSDKSSCTIAGTLLVYESLYVDDSTDVQQGEIRLALVEDGVLCFF